MVDVERRKQRQKKYYRQKREEMRCVQCGKQDERTLAGKVYCVECYAKRYVPYKDRKYNPEQRERENADKREWAKMHRDAGICVICGRKDKRTVNGKRMCLWCATEANRKARQRRANSNGKLNEQAKARRERWAAQGLCSACGHKKEEPQYKLCLSCRVRTKLARHRREKANGWKPRGADGICWQCNTNRAMEGKKMCPECYSKKLVIIKESGWAKGAIKHGNNHDFA